jgi:hypothetical protein
LVSLEVDGLTRILIVDFFYKKKYII